MKKTVITLCLSLFVLCASADDIMKREGKTYIINTTELCSAKGYKATTPLLVYIENGTVVKIEALPNKESKGYFERIKKKLLPQYAGQKVGAAKKLANAGVDELDGVLVLLTAPTLRSRTSQRLSTITQRTLRITKEIAKEKERNRITL